MTIDYCTRYHGAACVHAIKSAGRHPLNTIPIFFERHVESGYCCSDILTLMVKFVVTEQPADTLEMSNNPQGKKTNKPKVVHA